MVTNLDNITNTSFLLIAVIEDAAAAALSVALVVWWEWGALWRRIVRLETYATNVTAHEQAQPLDGWIRVFEKIFFLGGKGSLIGHPTLAASDVSGSQG